MATKQQNPKGAGIPKEGLTDQQILFCNEYARTLHMGQAYDRAGYKTTSRSSRDASASKLLKNPKVRAYLAEVANLSETSVVNAITAIAFTPITEVLRWDGENVTLRQTDHWTERAKLAVKRVKVTKRTRYLEDGSSEVAIEHEVELYDRQKALEQLMKKMKLYPKYPTEIEWLDEGVRLGLIPAAIEEAAVDGIGRVMIEAKSAISGEALEAKAKQGGLSPATIEEIKRSVLGIQDEPQPLPLKDLSVKT